MPDEDQMTVAVDRSRCQGHTLCGIAAPDIFLFNESDGHAYVNQPEVPIGREADVRAAAATCPERAIVLDRVAVRPS